MPSLKKNRLCLAFAAALAAGQFAAVAQAQTSSSRSVSVGVASGGGGSASSGWAASDGEAVGFGGMGVRPGAAPAEDRPWFGVAIEEAPEALTAQLGLKPGVGLVVTYIPTNSPAAKAGLHKNDLLTEFDDAALVLPAQLQKLVRVRKPGDAVKVVYYRAGKQQTASVTLAKAPPELSLLDEDRGTALNRLFSAGAGDPFRNYQQMLRQGSGQFKIDQQKIQEEVRRSMEQARNAYAEALRHSTNVHWGKALKELGRSRIELDKNASVTVRSTGQNVKSIVTTDDSGTIVIVRNPKPRLTAHDKEGKLLFDGEIDTPEQRDKVPRDLWKRVEPLLDKLAPEAEEREEDDGADSSQSTLPHPLPVLPPLPETPTV